MDQVKVQKKEGQGQEEKPFFYGFIPTKSQLQKLIKINYVQNPCYKKRRDYLIALGQARYPGVRIHWAYKELRTKGRKMLIFWCITRHYHCQARLQYYFDSSDSCYYLKNCNNQHRHFPRLSLTQRINQLQEKYRNRVLTIQTRAYKRQKPIIPTFKQQQSSDQPQPQSTRKK